MSQSHNPQRPRLSAVSMRLRRPIARRSAWRARARLPEIGAGNDEDDECAGKQQQARARARRPPFGENAVDRRDDRDLPERRLQIVNGRQGLAPIGEHDAQHAGLFGEGRQRLGGAEIVGSQSGRRTVVRQRRNDLAGRIGDEDAPAMDQGTGGKRSFDDGRLCRTIRRPRHRQRDRR